MKVCCISDLHGLTPELEDGDLLLIAGDCTASDKVMDWGRFFSWLKRQNYRMKVIVGGNHDNFLQECCTSEGSKKITDEDDDFVYLCDSGIEFEGFKIWGSPWSLWFKGINPRCKAFTGSESDLASKFALIPVDTDILVTHSPPFGVLDGIPIEDGSLFHAGSKSLATNIDERLEDLYLHVFGHIHEGYGKCFKDYDKDVGLGCPSINASLMNARYEADNKPIYIRL